MIESPIPGGLRGDYSDLAADFVVPQAWDSYGEDEHDRWRRLYARQSAVVEGRACEAFLKAIALLDAGGAIPDLDAVSAKLRAATGWSLVAVPGLLPNEVFFEHLAGRRFPVTRWIREESEIDYIVEPDIFHDFFGHVPLLFDPAFADYIRVYGEKGLEAERLGGAERLSRLYWYTVEFGLQATAEGFKALGAGILSSAAETVYATSDPAPNRIAFDLKRVMRTRYRIDDLQETYFVLGDLRQLARAIERPLAPLYEELAALPDLEAGEVLPTDLVLSEKEEA